MKNRNHGNFTRETMENCEKMMRISRGKIVINQSIYWMVGMDHEVIRGQLLGGKMG
jgi:hypothetical protein